MGGKFVSVVIFYVVTVTELHIVFSEFEIIMKKATEINSILQHDKGLEESRKTEDEFFVKLNLSTEVIEENVIPGCKEVSSCTYLNSLQRDGRYCTLQMDERDFSRNVGKFVPV